MGTPTPTRGATASLSLMLLALLVVPGGTAPTSETAPSCVRGCRCAALPEYPGAFAVNCSSTAAASALGSGPLGSRVRELRLTRHDDHLSVKEGAFHSLVALRSLHLDHLGLVKVYPGAFRGLDALEELDLSHNALSAGDEVSRALRDLPQLRRLYLRGNNFGSANGIAPSLVSRTLKYVDLGRCKLRDLPPSVLGGLSHVRHVVLDGNFIRQFSAASFPRSVVSLDLSHNDIDRISLKELNELENVDAIELADNPLHCSCDLWQVSYDYNINKEIVCASPKQLMGKNLLSLKKHQLCGGHKKVKREAGNELDDETLSGEENADDLEEGVTVEEKTQTALKTEQEDESENPEQHSENVHESSGKTSLDDTKSADNDSLKPENRGTEAEEVEESEGDEVGPENVYGEESVDSIVRDRDNEKTQLEGDRLTSGDKSEPIDGDESPEELVFVPEKKNIPVDDYEYDQSKVNVDGIPSNEKNGDDIETETSDGDSDASGVVEEKSSDKKIDDGSVTATKEDIIYDIINEGEGDVVNASFTEGDLGENSEDLSEVGVSSNVGGADETVNEGETKKTDKDYDFDDGTIEESPPDSLPASEYTRMQAAQEQENKSEARSKEINGEDDLNAGVFPNLTHENEGESQIQNEKIEEKSTSENSDSADGNVLTHVGTSDSETRPEQSEEIHSSSDEKLEASNKKTESHDPESEISETQQNMSELPNGQIVETVEDNENVVHTNDVGARMEDDSENEPSTGDEEVEGATSAEKENDNVEEKSLDEIEEKIEAEEADLFEKEKDFVNNENVEGMDSPDDEIDNETLEKELEDDKLHSTLGHSDLSEENGREPPFEDSETNTNTENEDPVEKVTKEKSAAENLPVSNDDEEKETINENDDVDHEATSEADEDDDSFIPRVAPEADGATAGNDYEEIKGGKETDAPGESISIAADTEESDEEEGSGTGDGIPVNKIAPTGDNSDDWSDDDVNETENEAIPPLDNAKSNEGLEEIEGVISEEKSEPSEAPPEDVIAGAEDENEEEGSGAGLLDRIPLEGGDEEPASNENDDGSGMLVFPVHVPGREEDEEEESSTNEPFIPIAPGFHDSSDGEKTSVDTEDAVNKDISEKESLIPTDIEKDSIPRRKIPVHSAPARPHGIHEENTKERQDPDKDGRGVLPAGKGEDDLVDPVSPPDDVESDVEGAEENFGTNENILDAVPELDSSADGSEALNKEGAFNFNTIASYIVLGAIMLLVVILLAYAVCRSRRQKSATTKEKDVENPGREMHDVNKPLINNHHPSAPEKQPLDETQQPLMTKEQEASLSLEPSEKIPLTKDETDHNPKQNGEVVVEQRPIANGKAASPAAIRAPSPTALAPAPTVPPVTPAPATSPVAPPALVAPASPAASPPRSPAHSPVADGHMNGNALPLANGGTHTPPRAASPALPASSPASGQPPVSPGAVRVVAKELPDSVAKRPVIIMNRGADPAQQV